MCDWSSSRSLTSSKKFNLQEFSSSHPPSVKLVKQSLLPGDSGYQADGTSSSQTEDWVIDELAPARLTACGNCDQLISGQCTLTGLDVLTEVAEPLSRCPLGLWPGEIPYKWLNTSQPRIPRNAGPCKILLTFPHGFGDHVQLTTVLLHLQRYLPGLLVDIACRAGCESLFRGLCRRAFPLGEELTEVYDVSIPLWWHEPSETYHDSPSTKAEKCLREVFRIPPDPALCRYACHVSADDESAAAAYLEQANATGRAVLIHYQGRCGRELKDVPESAVSQIVKTIRRVGFEPLVLDWDGKSELAGRGDVVNVGADRELWPTGIGDAGRLAALASQSRLCIGIDSGPGHLFGAVPTPTLIVWKYLHPINYFGLGDHVTHLVPHGHGRFIRGDRVTGERYFRESYRHRLYSEIHNDLALAVEEILSGG